MEKELGTELFDRSGRTATLTAAGKAAVEPARAALASVDSMRRAVDDVTGVVRGTLTVGMPAACTVTGLFDALAEFHRAHPGVDVSLVEDNSDRHLAGVQAGTTDLALVGIAGDVPDGLMNSVIVSDRIVAMFPADHSLSSSASLSLADLAALPLICMPVGTGIRNTLDRCCTRAEVTLPVALQASAPDTVADLAILGLGVAVLSESIAAGHSGRLASGVIDDAELPALLALVWKQGGNPALTAMLGFARRSFDLPIPGRGGPE